MTVNVDLLQRTLAHIEAHPEEWNQGTWRCGTAACFAGHAAILAGAQWAEPDYETAPWLDNEKVITPSGERREVFDYAPEVLGLAHHSHPLFNASNDLEDLRRIVGELCDGAL